MFDPFGLGLTIGAAMATVVWVSLALYLNHVAYKAGVWDGHFNTFIPKVKRYIAEYDRTNF